MILNMICTTILNRNLEQIHQALEECEMAEIRLDSCDLSMKDIDEVFSSDVPLVATCRIAELVGLMSMPVMEWACSGMILGSIGTPMEYRMWARR